MKPITTKNFGESLKTSKLVMLDFMASWCGPCKVMKNSIENVEDEYTGRVLFLSCDFDKDSELFKRFNVTSIPTLITFKGGCAINRQTGALLETVLKEKIDRLLKR